MASLQIRNGTYYAVFSISGRKKWKKIGKCQPAQAKRIKHQMEIEFLNNNFGIFDVKPIAFAEFVPIYLEKIKTTKAERTVKTEAVLLKNLTTFFGDQRLMTINKGDIENYRDQRVEQVKDRTVNLELTALSCLFKKAIEMKYLAKLPWEKSLKVKVRDQIEIQPLTVEEIDRLKAICSPWLYPFVVLELHSGMRKSEALWLEWDQVDFNRRVIKLYNKPGFKLKNLKRRDIPIDDDLLEVLQHHFQYYPKLNATKRDATAYLPRQEHQKRWVFCHLDGSRVQDIKTAFKNACKKAELEGTRIHDLRHTFASHLVMQGVSMKAVQELLGHQSIKITMDIYAHLEPEHIMASVNRLPYRSVRESKVIQFPVEKI
jgi:integrase